jgi:multidrug efflux system membrane fusion protein
MCPAGSSRGRPTAFLIGLALLATVAGCSRHGKGAPEGGSTVPPSQVNLKRGVELVRAEQKSVLYTVETVGYLEAEGQTDIAAGVNGIVDEVLFREGQWVDQNTILVKVDQRRYGAALELAKANEQRAQANLKLAEEMNRIAQGAGFGTTKEEKTKAEQGVKVAQAELKVAQAALDQAQTVFDRSQVRAPYAGQINQRRVTVGSFLEDRTVIGTMADLRRFRLVGWVPEKAAPTVRKKLKEEDRRRSARLAGSCLAAPSPWPGLASLALDAQGIPSVGYGMEFTLPAFPKRAFKDTKNPKKDEPGPFTGRIFYLSRVASPDTHMFECKAEVDLSGLDKDELQETGYSARVRIALEGNPAAVTVPEEAVKASERGNIVFVPESRDGKDGQQEWVARAKVLRLGFRTEGWVEVLDGLRPGEWVVSRGAEALENGTPIQFPPEQLKALQPTMPSPAK